MIPVAFGKTNILVINTTFFFNYEYHLYNYKVRWAVGLQTYNREESPEVNPPGPA